MTPCRFVNVNKYLLSIKDKVYDWLTQRRKKAQLWLLVMISTSTLHEALEAWLSVDHYVVVAIFLHGCYPIMLTKRLWSLYKRYDCLPNTSSTQLHEYCRCKNDSANTVVCLSIFILNIRTFWSSFFSTFI